MKKKGIKGNCLQACIASLFELPLESVPHFVTYPDDEWVNVFLDFIYAQGYIYEGYAPREELTNLDLTKGLGGYIIVTGTSPRGFKHAVIYKDCTLVHDPHFSRLGLVEIDGFHMIKRGNRTLNNPWRLFM